jgi:general secretion pathway protein J
MLIALTLLGIMVALVYDALRFGGRSSQAVAEHVDAAEQVRLGHSALRRLLTQAQPVSADLGDPDAPLAFVGGPEELFFVAPLPGRMGAGGLYAFRLFLAEVDGRGKLMLRYELFQSEDWERYGDDDQLDDIVLHEDVAEIALRYYGREGEDQAPLWRDSWEDPERLPELVSIALDSASTLPAAEWPELVVGPRVTGLPVELGG